MKLTVGMLIDQLTAFDPEASVRLAFQPAWPLEYDVERVTGSHTPPGDDDLDDAPGVVWIGQGDHIGYLPETATDAMGWQRDQD
ncbi:MULTISPECIES: hypothetical protein [Actinoalloteichus]|uniref:Uncharacterized protein n=1 Tax=Actinoalloteichus fjordicus TaxID=1612552 RepID=A0AAC9LDE2_9PSEU|nr:MULTISPECIES: hypothetical protein [Actinoalloteichus]APU15281.1 hypothetical protein UA74_16165 [Actinoalloteichus fjordicus]APU21326.1 hypothetical protein UA75_16590 [Actinoalloteichus sp. GBA129-24]